ncbi:MAG: prepilin peptidase [Actinomycetota bacterium]|nr:prepilin peptidase [Actinomycetota bacterium]
MCLWIVLMWLSRIAEVDLNTRRIPTSSLWPAIAATLAFTGAQPTVGLAALVTAAPYAVAAAAGLCGGGDVKLAFVLGGLLADVAAGLLVVLLAAVLGLAAHVVTRRRDGLPHAPALVAATVCVLASGG